MTRRERRLTQSDAGVCVSVRDCELLLTEACLAHLSSEEVHSVRGSHVREALVCACVCCTCVRYA